MTPPDPLKPVALRGTPLKRRDGTDVPQLPRTAPPTAPPASRVDEAPARNHVSPPSGFRNPAATGDPTMGGAHNRSVPRRPCSFPGVLRILLPEQSFFPEVFAVRIIDLSPSGARLETRQLTHDMFLQVNLEPRFVRLEIMIPTRNKITVSGKLVWTDFSSELSTMGISIHPRRDDLAEACLPKWDPSPASDSQFLAPPALDTYPTTTSKTPFRFTGRALDADLVLVEGNGQSFEAKPDADGRFAIELPLVPSAANEFQFTGLLGAARSSPTPAWIMHRPGHHDTQTYRPGGVFDEVIVASNGRTLKIKCSGDPAELLQSLKRIEEILGLVQTGSLHIELHGDAERARKCLIKGGQFPFKPSGEP
jgi:hypothetical protein